MGTQPHEVTPGSELDFHWTPRPKATGEAGSADDIPPFAVPPYYYLKEAHEVNPGNTIDFDWTLHPKDWPRVEALRQVRNEWLEHKLSNGFTVAYKQSGWSCYPRIHRDDMCYFKPTCGHWKNLHVGDIVFCAVEPGFRYYAHQIKAIEWCEFNFPDNPPTPYTEGCEPRFTISNLQGKEIGWCFIRSIYGKLTGDYVD